jgi:predicted RNA-binding Zn-ribbon protein involved in translation (DUF1610 family)
MSEHQSLENQDLPTCDACQIPMSAVPRDVTVPGPEYFGHRVFECPECGKTLVVSVPDGK